MRPLPPRTTPIERAQLLEAVRTAAHGPGIAMLRRVLLDLDMIEDAVRAHRDARGHARCWRDDLELYAVLDGSPASNVVPPRDEFLAGCERFYAARCATGTLDYEACPTCRGSGVAP